MHAGSAGGVDALVTVLTHDTAGRVCVQGRRGIQKDVRRWLAPLYVIAGDDGVEPVAARSIPVEEQGVSRWGRQTGMHGLALSGAGDCGPPGEAEVGEPFEAALDALGTGSACQVVRLPLGSDGVRGWNPVTRCTFDAVIVGAGNGVIVTILAVDAD